MERHPACCKSYLGSVLFLKWDIQREPVSEAQSQLSSPLRALEWIKINLKSRLTGEYK